MIISPSYDYFLNQEVVHFENTQTITGTIRELLDDAIVVQFHDSSELKTFPLGTLVPLGEVVDLFEHYENLPAAVQNIIGQFTDSMNYHQIESLHDQLLRYGFTFDSYLDACPYWLRPFNYFNYGFYIN